MLPFYVFLAWIISAGAATAVGYDRGRWEMGLVLGIACGPIGVIAAGLLMPSYQWQADRQYQIDRDMGRLRREDVAKVKERKRESQRVDYLVNALGEQIERRRLGLADGLTDLASELREFVDGDPQLEQRLERWINWLGENAQSVRINLDEPAPPASMEETD